MRQRGAEGPSRLGATGSAIRPSKGDAGIEAQLVVCLSFVDACPETRPRATLSKICSAVAVQTKVVPLAL